MTRRTEGIILAAVGTVSSGVLWALTGSDFWAFWAGFCLCQVIVWGGVVGR